MRPLWKLLLLAAIAVPGALPAAQDGLLDTGFAGDGIVTWTAGTANSIELEDAVATEGGTLIGVGAFTAGTAAPTIHFQAWTSSGALGTQACYDASSDLFPLSTESRGRSAIVDSTGNLLIGGSANFFGSEDVPRALVARFDLGENGCALDTAWSANGWEVFDDSDYCDQGCFVADLAEIAPATGAVGSPRVVALIESRVGALSANLLLVGLHSNGTVDTGFGANGMRLLVSPELGLFFPGTAHLEIDPRGRIYVLASHYDPDVAGDLDPAFVRLAADGDPDPGFGTGGVLITNGSSADDAIVRDLAMRSDGSVAYMLQNLTSGNNQQCLAQFPAAPHCNTNSSAVLRDILGQGDGKIVYAFEASVEDGIRARRASGNWISDPTFGPGGGPPQIDVDLGGGNGQTLSEMLLSGGRPVLAGTADAPSGRSAGFIARLTNSYLFCDGFEGGTPALWSTIVP